MSVLSRMCGVKKDGEYGNRNEYRVQKAACQPVAGADIGNDESKFAQLGKRKAAAHACFKRLAGKHNAEGGKNTFAGNERYCQGNNCKQAAAYYGRVYHHADGYEENAGKQILYRFKQNLGAARVNGSRKQSAH